MSPGEATTSRRLLGVDLHQSTCGSIQFCTDAEQAKLTTEPTCSRGWRMRTRNRACAWQGGQRDLPPGVQGSGIQEDALPFQILTLSQIFPFPVSSVLDPGGGWKQSSRGGALNNRDCFSLSSRGWKSKIKVWAGLAAPAAGKEGLSQPLPALGSGIADNIAYCLLACRCATLSSAFTFTWYFPGCLCSNFPFIRSPVILD